MNFPKHDVKAAFDALPEAEKVRLASARKHWWNAPAGVSEIELLLMRDHRMPNAIHGISCIIGLVGTTFFLSYEPMRVAE